MIAHVIIKRCGCKPISENGKFDHNFPRENPDCASLRLSTPKQEIQLKGYVWSKKISQKLLSIVGGFNPSEKS